MTTPMHPVISSQISYVGYEEETKELFVTFKNGSTYKYEGVSKNIFDTLLSSTSVGSYFFMEIKNHYNFIKIK